MYTYCIFTLADPLKFSRDGEKQRIEEMKKSRSRCAEQTSQQLQHADFVKPIRTWLLKASQLPNPIPGTTIRKPADG